jgi:hypothetical protein
VGSRLIQDMENLTVDAIGPDSLAYDAQAHNTLPPQSSAQAGPPESELSKLFDMGARNAYAATASARRFVSRGYTIAGGSSEVQHNLLAKQVLGL